MNMRPPASAPALLATLALLAALGTGCALNEPGTELVPTGVRSAPAIWPGGVAGLVFFDPDNAPDLAAPPFPPTRVELFQGATLVAVDSLPPFSRAYAFHNVPAGTYSLVVRSRLFLPNSIGNVQVRDVVRDAGNLTLLINPAAVSANLFVAGDIPGLGATTDDFLNGYGSMNQNQLGLWSYPNDLWPAVSIPAGTYRFKFVSDASSTEANLIGWGGSASELLSVPIVNHPAVFGSGPATDIVLTIPADGIYAFHLDERRQVFSIELAPAPFANVSRSHP